MKLKERTLNHIKSLGVEQAMQVYGLKESTIKTVLRTGKPSSDMMDKYEELETDSGLPASHSRSAATATQISPQGTAFDTANDYAAHSDIAMHPLIQEMLSKFGEITTTLNEIISALSGVGDRFANNENDIAALQGSIGQIQEVIAGIIHGNSNSPTIPQPTIERVDNGAEAYIEPERLSMTRTNRVPPLPVAGNGAPSLPAVPRIGASGNVGAAMPLGRPVGNPNPSRLPNSGPPVGAKFDWLTPYTKK